MRFLFSILVLFSFFFGFSQTENISDLTFIKDAKKPNRINAKLVKVNYHYLPDTLTIPFSDDFSTDKFKKYDGTGAVDSLKTSNYKSFQDSLIADSTFSLVQTYYYEYTKDSLGKIDTLKTALQDSAILFLTDTLFNAEYDTVKVYPNYEIHDSVFNGKMDTIPVTTNLNRTDSTLWKVVPADAPNAKIWLDNNVYITRYFAVQPPSIGAAVFEGLDSLGTPYDTITESYGLADKLTSKIINLSEVGQFEQLFLNFFFQPQGLGANPPDAKDSLILEFRTDSIGWETQWFSIGSNFKPFEKVSITVNNKFFKNSFQFRFKNYATLSGNLDIWLLDYVKLAKTSEINDVAFSETQSSLLQNYIAVPWQHYVTKPEALKNELLFEIKNNFSTSSKNVQFDASIIDASGVSVFEFTDNNLFVGPGIPFLEGLRYTAFSQFPSNANDSSSFEIISYIAAGVDEISSNDTVKFKQTFYNYYAYDDGSAETGYSLRGSESGEVALQFLALKSDSLRAVQMYFNRSLQQNIGVEFDLMVWDDINAPPIVQQLDTTKYYGINNFVTYKLRTPIKIGGTFYVGWKQRSKVELNVGLDRNDTLVDKLYFNQNGWSVSSVVGAPMIRPVFGTDFIVGINEQELASKFNIYPNPSSEFISIQSDFEIEKVEVLNLLGSIVLSSQNKTQINISDLPVGGYFIRIYFEENIITKKIIKQ